MRMLRREVKSFCSGGENRRLIVMEPRRRSGKPVPGVLWIHGGGYSTGMPEMVYASRARDLARRFGVVVVSPEYRLSGSAPYPAALEDCYCALLWLREHTTELGVDPSQIMVGGESAGGGLTAALCMLARDRGEIKIAFQMPVYPMLDDRDTPSSVHNCAPVWNTRRNHRGWKRYLRNIQGVPPVYAAPARQEDYSDLPPAYTFVGDEDPFYCETLRYVENLHEAGVEAEVDVYPRCFHAFDLLLPWKKASRTAARRFEEHFAYAMEHYRSPQAETRGNELSE